MALTPMTFDPPDGYENALSYPDPETGPQGRKQVQRGLNQLRDFINSAFFAELLSTASGKGASQVGIEDSGGKFTATNVEAALQEAANLISNLAGTGRTTQTVKGNADAIDTHIGQTISQSVSATHDNTVAEVQTISCSGTPKMIVVRAWKNATMNQSDGAWCQNSQKCRYARGDNGYLFDGGSNAVLIEDTAGNYTKGVIGNVTNGSFQITWTKTGSGATGTVQMQFDLLYH